jgi:uncharacterized protein (TIGR04255 family)
MKLTRPEFRKPPIVEQALTVLFDPITGFQLGDYGRFWDVLGPEFVGTEAKPVVEAQIEQFDEFIPTQIRARVSPEERLPNCYYRHKSGAELVQVQPDRFTFNWLKTSDNTYPRFERTMKRFRRLLGAFEQFVGTKGATLSILQCELTNVNIIPVSDFGKTFADAGSVLKMPDLTPNLSMMELEGYMQASRQLLLTEEGKPAGRLYTNLAPVLRLQDQQPAYRFELTARGAPSGRSIKTALKFFDVARDAINAAFMTAITTAAHDIWGAENGDSVQSR